MTAYIFRRLAAVIPTLLGISIVTFFLVKLIPGDMALNYAPLEATEEEVQAIRVSLGLADPLPVQYVRWLGKVVQGDFGYSLSQNRPVLDVLLPRLWNTVILATAALLLSTTLGIAVGIISAAKQRSVFDRGGVVLALLGASMPPFWLGLLLIVVLGQELRWFPISGMYSARGDRDLLDLLHHLVLPAVTLGAALSGIVARMTRSAMLEVLRQDYVRTARSKGLSERRVLIDHAFRNAAPLVTTVVGLQLAGLLGGTVIIEAVFSWPGLGFAAADAILRRDVLVVQGVVLLSAAIFVFVNLLVDLAYGMLDPRIRYQ